MLQMELDFQWFSVDSVTQLEQLLIKLELKLLFESTWFGSAHADLQLLIGCLADLDKSRL